MIPENISIIYLVIPVLCFIYIFRGIGSDTNPIWGNILASGLSVILCAMAAIWLSQGSIVSPSLVGNSTYQISPDMTVGEIAQEQANISDPLYSIGAGGSGMFMRAPMSVGDAVPNATVTVYTYDIVYNQFQNLGLALLYMLGCVLSIGLLGWFIIDMRRAIEEQNYYEDNNYGED